MNSVAEMDTNIVGSRSFCKSTAAILSNGILMTLMLLC